MFWRHYSSPVFKNLYSVLGWCANFSSALPIQGSMARLHWQLDTRQGGHVCTSYGWLYVRVSFSSAVSLFPCGYSLTLSISSRPCLDGEWRYQFIDFGSCNQYRVCLVLWGDFDCCLTSFNSIAWNGLTILFAWVLIHIVSSGSLNPTNYVATRQKAVWISITFSKLAISFDGGWSILNNPSPLRTSASSCFNLLRVALMSATKLKAWKLQKECIPLHLVILSY